MSGGGAPTVVCAYCASPGHTQPVICPLEPAHVHGMVGDGYDYGRGYEYRCQRCGYQELLLLDDLKE